MRKIPALPSFIFILALLLTSPAPVVSSPDEPEDLAETIIQNTAGQAEIAYHSETGLVRYIGSSPDNPIFAARVSGQNLQAEETAAQFLAEYGSLFGLQNPERELVVMKMNEGELGYSFVRYQQVYEGIPVLGGELIVAAGSSNSVTAALGEILPGITLDLNPAVAAETARQAAIKVVSKEHQVEAGSLAASEPELWIHNPILLGGPGLDQTALVWRIEVTPTELLPIRELVLIDAHRGIPRLNFNQIDAFLHRSVYDKNNSPSSNMPGTLVRAEGWGPTGLADADNAYDFAGDTYQFYNQYHRRNSIDNRGMNIISTVRYCPPYMTAGCSTQKYKNAFWNGYQMVYGDGFASADDVVAHELTHGVTEHTSGLFYYYQSGAINEAFSDIWGEFVDLINGKGNDTDNVRWLMGEDLPASIGAIRSMKNPPLFGDPDRMSSPYYYCGVEDNGGVHYNSGIANKAVYLMVDGGVFNGKTIKGIGIQKTAEIWYEAQANMLTSAADYNDLYYSLQTSCSILSGTPYSNAGSAQITQSPYKIFTPFAMNRYRSSGITASDCQEVKKALDAVEMYARPPASCFTNPISMCSVGYKPVPLFSDNLENPASGNWISGPSGSSRWYYPPPNYAIYATSGRYNLWGDNPNQISDSYIAMTRSVALPVGSTPYLHFKHAFAFEPIFDGGVIEFSTNQGATWHDAGTYFPISNGYNGSISTVFDNPLRGRQAFTYHSSGYTSSRLTLASIAGNNVRFRFRIGTDSDVGNYGWYIDDINVYTCSASTQ
jgi:bacillolysin